MAVLRNKKGFTRKRDWVQYQIEKGDTLWSIAEDEMGPGWSDIREYVYLSLIHI